jgi:hypothetical protein
MNRAAFGRPFSVLAGPPASLYAAFCCGTKICRYEIAKAEEENPFHPE